MFKKKFKLGSKYVGEGCPTYFIADIASNHDQNLTKAKNLIELAKEAGADAVKFQHFSAESLVSDIEFKKIRLKSHQSKWDKSVFDTYKDNALPLEWTNELYKFSKKSKIDFFTAPYSENYIDYLNKFVCAFKIGSGDITYIQEIKKIAKKNKPTILATGASKIQDVERAVRLIKQYNSKLILMQCNTNYTAKNDNFNHLNINVLNQYKKKFNIITGLSDHTKGDLSVIAAVSLGAKVVEKHFTSSNSLKGPDHPFSMNPTTWKAMVEKVRLLEKSLGTGKKIIQKNESETAILQRRSIMLNKDLKKNQKIYYKDLIFLRPNIKNGFQPYEYGRIVGKKIKKDKKAFEAIQRNEIF